MKQQLDQDMRKDPQSAAEPVRLICFGPAPLFDGEDSAGYDDLLARVSGAIKPADIIEEIWIRDIVGLTWEALRWRRARAALLSASRHVGIQHLLEPLCGLGEAIDLSEQWARRDDEAVAAVDRTLATAGLPLDAVMAQTLAAQIDLVERIERMIVSAEMRRNATLREIERHRSALAARLREATRDDAIPEAEFEMIDAPPTSPKAAAAGAKVR